MGQSAPEVPSHRRTAAWLVPIAVTCIALYFRQLFLGQTFVLRDHLVYTWPERKVLADALHAGRIPEWNDLIGFGTQFAASSANGVSYPPLWLVALLPLPFSMDLVIVLHVLFAGIGTALLARRLGANALGTALAGGAFMACGYVASIAPNKIFTGTAWLPWVAWAADRVTQSTGARERVRDAAVLAAVVGAQFLAGDPASSITSGLVALIVACSRSPGRIRSLGWLAGAYAAALLLAAAGVLPGLALLPHTVRGTLTVSEATTWSLHPWRLFELFWPHFLGNALDPAYNLAELVANSGAGELEPSWSLSLYLGAPILALAILAVPARIRGARGLWLGIGTLVVLALGATTPLYSVFRAVFPPERITRYPEKHVVGAICLLCVLAGAAVPRLSDRYRAARWTFAAAVACIALPLTIVALLRGWLIERLGGAAALMVPPLEWGPLFEQSLRSGATSLAVALAACWLFLRSAHARFSRPAGAFAVALCLGHAVWEAWTITPSAPARLFSRLPSLLRTAAAAASPTGLPLRIYRSPVVDADILPEARPAYWHETLYLDGAARFGFAAVPGFEGWRSPELAALRARVAGLSLDTFLTLYAIDHVALPSEVRQRLFPQGSGRPRGSIAELELGFAADRPEGKVAWTLIRTAGVRPRAFVAARWRWAPSARALDMLVDPARGADGDLVVLTGDGSAGGGDEGKLTPCTVAAYRPERIALECDSPSGGYAVLADENAPGWSATVDGERAPISSADVLLRAVPVSRGRHRVEFSYRTPLLRAGAIVSALAWLGVLALFCGMRRRSAPSVVERPG